MGNPKITGFIIALLLVGFFTASLGTAIAKMSSVYSVGYDNSSLESYNKLEDLNEQAEGLENKAITMTEKEGIVDIIGGYFSSGYQALVLTKDSYDTFDEIKDQSIKDANLGATGEYLKLVLGGIVLILIFVGVIISAIVKRDL